jgi:hypothetical protein
MAPWTTQLYRIVETRPGPGTAETHYRTADGRWWEECSADLAQFTAPPIIGRVCNGYIKVP